MTMSGWKPTISLIHPSIPSQCQIVAGALETSNILRPKINSEAKVQQSFCLVRVLLPPQSGVCTTSSEDQNVGETGVDWDMKVCFVCCGFVLQTIYMYFNTEAEVNTFIMNTTINKQWQNIKQTLEEIHLTAYQKCVPTIPSPGITGTMCGHQWDTKQKWSSKTSTVP